MLCANECLVSFLAREALINLPGAARNCTALHRIVLCLPYREQVLKSFSKLCPSSSLVARGGKTLELDSTTLVMGDVVTLK